MSYTTAEKMCLYTSVAEVLAGAFGGKDKPAEDLSQLAPDQFGARFDQLMGGL